MKFPATVTRDLVLTSGRRGPRQYLTGLDLFNGHIGVPIVLTYPGGLDADRLQAGLTRVLEAYPTVAGRIRQDEAGLPYIDCNDAGVRLRVKRWAGPMPRYGVHRPVGADLRRYFDPVYPWRVVGRDTALFDVQLHEFADGGCLLCTRAIHSLFDGSAYWQFMQNWAAACRGEAFDPPVLDRLPLIEAGAAHLPPAAGSQLDIVYEPGWVERASLMSRFAWRSLSALSKEVFHFSAAQIEQWRAGDATDAPGASAADLVTAHCLKQLSPLFPSPANRQLGMVFDLRFKRGLEVPRHYSGNALGYGQAAFTPQELALDSVADLARRCRPRPIDSQPQTLRDYLGLMEAYRRRKAIWKLFLRSAAGTLEGGFILNNSSRFPMYEIDFGQGRPQWHDVCGVAFRMLMIVPSGQADGGLDIHLTALRHELDAMRRLHPSGAAT